MDIEINRLTEIAIYTGSEPDENSIWIDDESAVRIEAGSLHLNNSIVDTDLKFGQLIAGEFQVTLFNLTTDVSGRNIKVWVIENGVRSELFTGKIESAEHDNINQHRQITAYDWAYYNRDKNVADFWNDFWETNKDANEIRLDWFRSSLLNYLDIMGSAGSLYNDDLNIAGAYDKVTVLTFESLLIMICELQCAFPHINAGGALDFVSLDNSNTADLRTNKIEGDSSRWEDFTVQPIDGIAVWEDSNNMLFVQGEQTNPYNITSNLFFLCHNESWQKTKAASLLLQYSQFSYVPCSLNMIVSDLGLELGQRIQTDKGYSYIMSNEIFGSLWVEQTLECRATSGTRKLEGSTYNDNMVDGLKTAVIKKDIDELSIKYTNVKNQADQLGTDISIIAGRVVMKVNKNGNIAEMRLDADPESETGTEFTVKANQINLDGYNIVLNGTEGIAITSPNFNVTNEGIITAISGYIGGVAITEKSIGTAQFIPCDKVGTYTRYKSVLAHKVVDGRSRATIKLKGYTKFVVVIRSDGETGFDYTCAGRLDEVNIPLSSTSADVQGHTQYNQKTDVPVTYTTSDATPLTTGEHTIEILYGKDGSIDTSQDCGWFYVDESQCEGDADRSFEIDFIGETGYVLADDGVLYAQGAKIKGTVSASDFIGGSINIGNGTFVVDNNGNLTANSATVNGTIKSGTGDTYTELSSGLLKFTTNAKIQFASTMSSISSVYDVLTFTNSGTDANPIPSVSLAGAPLTLTSRANTIYLNATAIRFAANGNYTFTNLNSGSATQCVTIDTSGKLGVVDIPPDVVANPSGTASTALTKLTIGSTIYSVGGTNVVANPSGSASTELAKLTVGSTTYSVSRVSANPPLAGSTTLQRIQIDGTTYEMPSGGGGSVGQRVDVSPSPTLITVTNDTYKSIKRITLSKGTYLIQATVKFKDETDIQVGIGTENNTHDLQSRAYGSDKLSVSRIIVNPNNTDMYVYIGVYCKGSSNIIKTGYNYGSGADVNDKTIIEYIKLND